MTTAIKTDDVIFNFFKQICDEKNDQKCIELGNNWISAMEMNLTNMESNLDEKDKEGWSYIQLALQIIPQKIFIGKSPKNKMTEFSGGHGKYFDGNTILVKIDENKYIYIGGVIYSFTTDYEITKFISPVGNNDVPYPYAIDIKNNYYIMLDATIMSVNHKIDNPYDYYYFKKDKINKIYKFKNVKELYKYNNI